MNNRLSVYSWLCLFPGLLVLASCAEFNQPVQLPSAGAQANVGAPISAQVAILSIPADLSLPNFKVTVEPFQTAASGITSGGGAAPLAPNEQISYTGHHQGYDRPIAPIGVPGAMPLDDRIGIGVASQLLSTLSNVGNITVIDYQAYRQNPDRYQNDKPGVFIIKGTVTEFNETSELADQKKAFSGNSIGNVAGTIGRGIGSDALSMIGRLVVDTNTSTNNTMTKRRGVVGLDIQVVNGDGVMLSSFPCSGTFTTISATKAAGTMGFNQSSSAYQTSAIGQAQRVALNDAAEKILASLKQRGR